jgi:putative Mg2+ transporter-C (MgtC) family protein
MVEAVLTRTTIPEWEIVFRLLVAILLGGLIGWERETKNRPAGLRTHMMTALASAGLAIMSLELVTWSANNGTKTDPTRAIEAVTAGVAFLAAGTIIQSRGKVIGLTTGAGMWLAGALGLAAGFGYHFIAIAMGLIAFVILFGLQRLSETLNPTVDENAQNTINGAAGSSE